MNTDSTLPAHAAHGRSTKSVARILPVIARVLLGLMFVVVGLNGFLNFLPQPSTPMPQGALAFLGSLVRTGYLVPLLMGTQALVGALLVLNRFVPLALAVIAPIVVNILAFHLFLDPREIGIAIIVLALEVYLTWAYRKAYRPMLAMRATPGARIL